MKSIRTKITLCLMVTVLATQLAVGASSITLNYNSTISTVDQMMSETATLAAERIEQELSAYKNVAMDTGCIAQLLDEEVPLDEKRSIIDERASMHNFQRGNIVGATASVSSMEMIIPTANMSGRPCRAMSTYPSR